MVFILEKYQLIHMGYSLKKGVSPKHVHTAELELHLSCGTTGYCSCILDLKCDNC